MRYLTLIAIATLFCSACSLNEEWTGFYYSDPDNIDDKSTWTIQPGIKSIEECRDWVTSTAGSNPRFDYECGYNCKYDNNLGTSVCEKTEK